MTRHCAHPGCGEQGSATFGYDYAQRVVWMVDLTEEGHPSTYDLCRRHATAMSVPRGWELRDRRNLVPSLVREAS